MAQEYINSKACRDFALRWAKENRRGWEPTQLADSWLDDLNTKVQLTIQKSIMAHRSVGKTIKDML